MTKKGLVLAAILGTIPVVSMADNVGNCGWGSKVFDGQSGVVPQSLAVTTNGTFGNQTFGITSGTSGCTQDGTVKSSWMTAMFIDGNRHQLARDMAVGEGETLDALASLIGVEEQDRNLFNQTVKNNYSTIYTSEDASAIDIMSALKLVLSSDVTLARYSENVS